MDGEITGSYYSLVDDMDRIITHTHSNKENN